MIFLRLARPWGRQWKWLCPDALKYADLYILASYYVRDAQRSFFIKPILDRMGFFVPVSFAVLLALFARIHHGRGRSHEA